MTTRATSAATGFRVAVIAVAGAWVLTTIVFGAPVIVRGRGSTDIAAIHAHPGYAVLHLLVVNAGIPLLLAVAIAPIVRHLGRDGALFAIVFAALSCAVFCAITVAVGVWLVVDDTAAPTAELVAIGTLNTLNAVCAALIATATITLVHSPRAPTVITPPARLLLGATGYACALAAMARLGTPAVIT